VNESIIVSFFGSQQRFLQTMSTPKVTFKAFVFIGDICMHVLKTLHNSSLLFKPLIIIIKDSVVANSTTLTLVPVFDQTVPTACGHF
jgi:hypothetical protein